MKRIYLASPYSHPETAVRLERTARVRRVCARLNELPGINCYSPINHGHDLPHHPEVAKSDAFWRPLNEDEIRRSDELHVLMLDGWEASVGVAREIRYAGSLGKPVVYIGESCHASAAHPESGDVSRKPDFIDTSARPGDSGDITDARRLDFIDPNGGVR